MEYIDHPVPRGKKNFLQNIGFMGIKSGRVSNSPLQQNAPNKRFFIIRGKYGVLVFLSKYCSNLEISF
jgi:hypothetical protein